MTDYPYKTKIKAAVKEWPQRFQVPELGVREYLLQNRCKADFCFVIKPKGYLFVEDDDGARGVNNLVKYWIWCSVHPEDRPVHVVHIIETSRNAQIENIRFLAKRMQEAISGFVYHLIPIENWQVPEEVWLPTFRNCLKQIDGLMNGQPGHMFLKHICYAEIQHLQEPEQLFAYADAYRSAAATICQQVTGTAARSTWPNAVVVLMLTAHAVELFLKAALLKRSPTASERYTTHRIDILSAKYRLQFPGPSFEWDIPFSSSLTVEEWIKQMKNEFPDLTEDETNEMREELIEKQKGRPAPSILYRYPTDNSGTEWRGREGFEPHSFLFLLAQLENDFKRIMANLE